MGVCSSSMKYTDTPIRHCSFGRGLRTRTSAYGIVRLTQAMPFEHAAAPRAFGSTAGKDLVVHRKIAIFFSYWFVVRGSDRHPPSLRFDLLYISQQPNTLRWRSSTDDAAKLTNTFSVMFPPAEGDGG